MIETQPRLARFRDSRLDGRYPRAWFDGVTPLRIGRPVRAAMLARTEAIKWRSRRRYYAMHYGGLKRAVALRIARGR